MRVLFFGGKERGWVCLKALEAEGHEIVGIVWDRPVDREFPIDPFFGGVGDEEFFVRHYQRADPEVLVLAGYPKLIGKNLMDIPSKMCINLHAGPLPRYRGPHPMNWMLINGETQGAFSIIEVDEGVDTGPILAQEWFYIDTYNDYNDLLELSLRMYPDMLVKVLQQIENGTVRRKRQSPNDGFWCSRRYPADGNIDWAGMTDRQVHNLVRALVKPMPGARAFTVRPYEGVDHKIIIEETRLLERTYKGVPGRVAAHLKNGVVVICQNRGILITKCRLASGEIILPVLPPTGEDLV